MSLGIVPVVAGGPAPDRCAALLPLAGEPLLVRAVRTLLAADLSRVLVTVSPDLVEAVREVLAGVRARSGAPVDVVPVDVGPVLRGGGLEAVSAALPGQHDAEIVLVHDALHPLASPALVTAVGGALTAGGPAVAAVAVRTVTDTLKWVDAEDVITGTADREDFRVLCSPVAARAGALRAVLASRTAMPDPGELAALLGLRGEVLTVPAPQDVFRVADADDLELAEAILAQVAQGIR